MNSIGFVRDRYAGANGSKPEARDCVIRATSIAANLDYDFVHRTFAKHGRMPRRATKRRVSFNAFAELFPGVERKAINLTLAQFIQLHPKGRFIVFTNGHAFAVIDSVVHDWSRRPRCRIRLFWEVPNGN